MKILILLLLIASVIAGDQLLVVSDPSTTTILNPAGAVVGLESYHSANNPNFAGYGPQWIWIKGSSSRPEGEQVTFQALFAADCPQEKATMSITADNVFTAYLNGEPVGSGNVWTNVYKFSVSVICGVNNLTVVATNQHNGSPAALIFKISQNQDKCYNCLASAHYNRRSCKCQCDSASCSSCPRSGQKWMDYPSCGCKCINRPFVTCHLDTQYFDEGLCSCQCKAKVCPQGKEQDPTSCSCKCKAEQCPASMKWNYDSCGCQICTQTAPCASPKIWNSPVCGCVCPATQCEVDETLDSDTCTCK